MDKVYSDLTGRVTQDDLLQLDILREPSTLQEWAATKAARELTENWIAALYEGYSLDEVLKDIDEVIEHLRNWKNSVRYAVRTGELVI